MLAKDLTASQRNMLAMAIAIGKEDEISKVTALILDEADASVPEAEAEVFLKHVRSIADMNIPVVMVTHRLKAVRQFCDDVTILNGGKVVYDGLMKDTEDTFMISKMSPQQNAAGPGAQAQEKSEVGKVWSMMCKHPPVKKAKPVLTFKDVEAYNLDQLNFDLMSGEILGFVGVPDSGVTQLPLVLGCDLRRTGGEYRLNGTVIPRKAVSRVPYSATDCACCLPTETSAAASCP
jgi:ABC-type sugar transport system ATPase subunit